MQSAWSSDQRTASGELRNGGGKACTQWEGRDRAGAGDRSAFPLPAGNSTHPTLPRPPQFSADLHSYCVAH